MKYFTTWKQKIIVGVVALHGIVLVSLVIDHCCRKDKTKTSMLVRTVAPLSSLSPFGQITPPPPPEPTKNPPPKPLSPTKNPPPKPVAPHSTSTTPAEHSSKTAPTPKAQPTKPPAPPQTDNSSTTEPQKKPPPQKKPVHKGPIGAPPGSTSPSSSDLSPGEGKPTHHPPPPAKTTTPSEADLPPGAPSPQKPKSSSANEEIPLPAQIESSTSFEYRNSVDNLSYEEHLIAFLQQTLSLPEYGEVLTELTLNRQGELLAVRIVSSQSEQNGTFLKKRLPELFYPWFNETAPLGDKASFTVVFRNEELASCFPLSTVSSR